MRAATAKRILGLTGLMAFGMVSGAQAQNEASRLAAGVPTGQAVLLSRGEVAVAAPGQSRVLIVDSMGTTRILAGAGEAGFSGDGGPAIAARLSGPSSLVADGAGNLYVADTGNNRIRRIDSQGVITTVAGSGIAGFDGDDALALSASLDSPSGVAFDPSGNLYVADTGNNRIRRVDSRGIITTVAGSDGALNAPTGLAFDTLGARLLVADTGNHVVRSLEADGTLRIVAGSSRPGLSGDGGPAVDARLLAPTGVGTDPAGNVYVADTGNHLLRRIDAAGSIRSVDETLQTPVRMQPSPGKPAAGQPGRRIVVTSPAAGESWQASTVHTIRWTHNLGVGARFAVDVSHDGGLTWKCISTRTNTTPTSVSWRVTNPSTAGALVRVRSTAADAAFGVSPSFQIWMVE